MKHNKEKRKKIFVKYLTIDTNENDLIFYFKKFGKIQSCKVLRKPGSRISRKIAHIIFEKELSANHVLQVPNSHSVKGASIKVEACLRPNEVRERKEKKEIIKNYKNYENFYQKKISSHENPFKSHEIYYQQYNSPNQFGYDLNYLPFYNDLRSYPPNHPQLNYDQNFNTYSSQKKYQPKIIQEPALGFLSHQYPSRYHYHEPNTSRDHLDYYSKNPEIDQSIHENTSVSNFPYSQSILPSNTQISENLSHNSWGLVPVDHVHVNHNLDFEENLNEVQEFMEFKKWKEMKKTLKMKEQLKSNSNNTSSSRKPNKNSAAASILNSGSNSEKIEAKQVHYDKKRQSNRAILNHKNQFESLAKLCDKNPSSLNKKFLRKINNIKKFYPNQKHQITDKIGTFQDSQKGNKNSKDSKPLETIVEKLKSSNQIEDIDS